MQQLHVEAEKETRYDLETVKRAATLAVKLQESRRESLSQAEVDAMAAEAGIDPVCMRQALHAIRQEQARTIGSQRSVTPRKAGASVALGVGLIFAVGLFVPGFYLMRSASVAPPPVMAAEVLPVAPTPAVTTEATLPSAHPMKNGVLTASGAVRSGALLSAGSTAIPAWKILSGQACYLRLPGSGQGAVALGPNTWFEQLIPTVTGATYRLRYELAGEAGPEARLHRVTAKVIQPNHAETRQEASVFTESGATGPTGWTVHEMEFQAQDVAARISFGNSQSADGTNMPVIRNIQVEQTSNVQTP